MLNRSGFHFYPASVLEADLLRRLGLACSYDAANTDTLDFTNSPSADPFQAERAGYCSVAVCLEGLSVRYILVGL